MTIQILRHPIVFSLIIVVLLVISLYAVDIFFKKVAPKFKKVPTIHQNFIRGCLRAFLIISAMLFIGQQFNFIQEFFTSILMSSSLIVVVVGFILQQGLSNIVHGFILSLSKPFDVGDRIRLTVDGADITGHVESISLRSTVIKNVLNSARVIIPNSKIDLGIIESNVFNENAQSSNFIDLTISYTSDIDLACTIVAEEIFMHPMFCRRDDTKKPEEVVRVFTRALADWGINLRATVFTNTIEENFIACSDIRRSIVKRVQQTPGVAFASMPIDMTVVEGKEHLS